MVLTVTKGLYSVLLGDTNLTHMSVTIPLSAFTNSDVRLRVWFNDGTNGFQMLAPDQRLGAVGYALVAAGLSFVWGTVRIFNFAQGAMLMLGAYVAWYVTDPSRAGLGLAAGISVAVVVLALGVLLSALSTSERPAVGAPTPPAPMPMPTDS